MANNATISNFHVEYMDVTQHWSPHSEKFAGADSLLTMLNSGWEMNTVVKRKEHWFAGMRLVYIYYVELVRGDEKMIMPVLHNPYINRLIMSKAVTVKPMDD